MSWFGRWFGSENTDREQVAAWQALVEHAEEATDVEKDEETVSISLEEQIERMIAKGCHRFAMRSDGSGRGMSAAEYRALWPKSIPFPREMQLRFGTPVLADYTLSPEGLARAVRIETRSVKPGECRDLVEKPTGEDGQPLKRAILFCQLTGGLVQSANAFRESRPADEVCLTGIEAAMVAVQYGDWLRRRSLRNVGYYSVRIPGTTAGPRSVLSLKSTGRELYLSVDWSYGCNNGPEKDVNDFTGNASRSVTIIPVP